MSTALPRAMGPIRLQFASCPRGKGQVPHHGYDFMAVEASGASGICKVVLSNPRPHTCGTLTPSLGLSSGLWGEEK